MKPVLIVEGKAMEVMALNWYGGDVYKVEVYEDNPMLSTIYYDVNWNGPYVERHLRLDLSKCLVDENDSKVAKKIHSKIEELIEVKSKCLIETSLEHTEACLKYPHSADAVKRRYELIQREQIGLIESLTIAESFISDDVDLTGGESNDTE